MAFRLRYAYWVDVLPSGTGQMAAFNSPLQGPVGGAGFGQTIEFFNSAGGAIVAGSGTTPANGALLSSDVTTMLNAAQTDIGTQIGLQLTRINNFLIGQG